MGKRLGRTSQVSIEKMDESEPLMKHRENELSVRTHTVYFDRGISIAATCLLAIRQALLRRHEVYTGLSMEQGRSCFDVKGKVQVGRHLQG